MDAVLKLRADLNRAPRTEDPLFHDEQIELLRERLPELERAVVGKPRNEQTADSVVSLATQGAQPLNYNHFKIPLMENLVRRALRA